MNLNVQRVNYHHIYICFCFFVFFIYLVLTLYHFKTEDMSPFEAHLNGRLADVCSS